MSSGTLPSTAAQKSPKSVHNMTDRQYHPLSGIVPLLGGEDFTAFVANIRDNGLLEPIVLHPDGSILDGRNRYHACIEAGVEPRFRTFGDRASDGDDPRAFVISLNIMRRHLSESQRAMIAARLANLDEGRPSKTTAIAGVSQGEAAELCNVSVDSIGRAKKVLNSAIPEIVAAMDSGQVYGRRYRWLDEIETWEVRNPGFGPPRASAAQKAAE